MPGGHPPARYLLPSGERPEVLFGNTEKKERGLAPVLRPTPRKPPEGAKRRFNTVRAALVRAEAPGDLGKDGRGRHKLVGGGYERETTAPLLRKGPSPDGRNTVL